MKIHWILLLALLLAGCGQSGAQTPSEPQAPPLQEPASPPQDSPNATQPVEISPLPTPSPDSSLQGDSPSMPDPSNPTLQKLIALAAADLTQRFSIPAEQVQFKEAAAVTWPDSSLGCPNPSSMYLQVLTPGYLIRLQAAERTFEYHTDLKETVIYCENPSALPLDALPKE
ncbi:MAG: hypothetical protein HRF47_04895 [Chloroflexota bacterium]|jgi:hypothetical protein